jgi:hypothetical protein
MRLDKKIIILTALATGLIGCSGSGSTGDRCGDDRYYNPQTNSCEWFADEDSVEEETVVDNEPAEINENIEELVEEPTPQFQCGRHHQDDLFNLAVHMSSLSTNGRGLIAVSGYGGAPSGEDHYSWLGTIDTNDDNKVSENLFVIDDEVKLIAPTSDGGWLFTGVNEISGESFVYFTENGKRHTFDRGMENRLFLDAILDSRGDNVIVGMTENDSDVRMMKFNSVGDITLIKVIDEQDLSLGVSRGYSIKEYDNGYLICSQGNMDWPMLFKTDYQGNVEWISNVRERIYGDDYEGCKVELDDQNNIYLLYLPHYQDSDDKMAVMGINAQGDERWRIGFTNSYYDDTAPADNAIMIAGANRDEHEWYTKVSSSGDVVFEMESEKYDVDAIVRVNGGYVLNNGTSWITFIDDQGRDDCK